MSIDVLQERIRALKNPTMVGLDPTPEVVPGYLLEEARQELGATPAAAAAAYGRFCRELLEGLRDVVPAVKVQSACFDVLGERRYCGNAGDSGLCTGSGLLCPPGQYAGGCD
ncbi:MAG: hypothetical protein ACLU9S_06445 [Oscillospiraceae bacterium]